jgi:hypothetical protein
MMDFRRMPGRHFYNAVKVGTRGVSAHFRRNGRRGIVGRTVLRRRLSARNDSKGAPKSHMHPIKRITQLFLWLRVVQD